MPLIYAQTGSPVIIKKIGGNDETKKFLEKLGFVAGSTITVVNEVQGNIIVNVKDSRVAVSKEIAGKIIV